jgi:hypothetical protein
MQSMRYVAESFCEFVNHGLQQFKIRFQVNWKLCARDRDSIDVQADESGALGKIVMQLSRYASALFFLGVE